MFSLPVCWAHRTRFSLNQSRLQLSLLRSRYVSSRLVPGMGIYGFPATGPMGSTATSGFMATGLWHLSRGYSGLRVIGAMQAAPTSGMAVIGVPASDTTAGSATFALSEPFTLPRKSANRDERKRTENTENLSISVNEGYPRVAIQAWSGGPIQALEFRSRRKPSASQREHLFAS